LVFLKNAVLFAASGRLFTYRDVPAILAFSAALLTVLALVVILLVRSRNESKRLEKLVDKRTELLSLKTATLTALFDAIPDLVYTKDLDLNYTHRNKAFTTYYDAMKANAETEAKLEEYSDEHDEINRQVMDENKAISVTERVAIRGGAFTLYETIRLPLTDKDGKVIGVMGISRDITKHKEIEMMLSKESQSKSSFLANVSHEIRTPLNTVVGVSNIMLAREDLDEDAKENLGKISIACDVLLGIINDTLDLSKIEASKLDIVSEKYDVSKLLGDAVVLNTPPQSVKPIEFELEVDSTLPVRLIGDELRIKQILNNLLSNAFKYTDSGKVTLSAKNEYVTGERYMMLILCVKDTGHGMTKSQLGKIFDEYSRFNRGPRDAIIGTGLGLAVVQRLVGLMGGKIEVESNVGEGTQFTVRLRQGMVDSEVLGDESAQNLMQFKVDGMTQKKTGEVVHSILSHAKVLVVDDVESNLHVATGLLKLYALNIETASGGWEAIAKVEGLRERGEVYDIIFMDHMMPKMDGIETARRIRDSGYTAPIIALTANATAGHENLFFQNGFDDFISKPVDMRMLDMVLNKFIAKSDKAESAEPPDVPDAPEPPAVPKPPAKSAATANRPGGKEQAFSGFPRELLLDCFVKDAESAVAMLERFTAAPGYDGFAGADPESGDLKSYIICVHGAKSTLYNVGEVEMSELAYDLEFAGRAGDSQTIVSRTPRLIEVLKELSAQFEAELNAGGSSGEMSVADFRENLLQIKQACENYSRKLAMKLISDLEKYQHGEQEARVLNTVKNFVSDTDFDEAAAVIGRYTNRS
jgi:PAS domain S-box-containing protein